MPEPPTSSQTDHSPRDVLIVGDWFVDEYWFLVRHYSEVSSHAGPVHYRVLSAPMESVKDLCGAGLIARVLYEMRQYKSASDAKTYRQYNLEIKKGEAKYKPAFKIIGLGIWHPDDTELLKHMIHARWSKIYPALRCGYTLRNKDCGIKIKDDDLRLVNLEFSVGKIEARLDQLNQKTDLTDEEDHELETLKNELVGSTTRVIRTYRYKDGSYKQLGRIDWEPRRDPDRSPLPEITDGLTKNPDDLSHEEKEDSIDIIIDDHGKGVINKKLIEFIKSINDYELDHHRPEKALNKELRSFIELLKKYKTAYWYVRTKNKGIDPTYGEAWPDWIAEIDRIKVLNISSEITARAFPNGGLLTKDDQISRNVFYILNEIKTKHGITQEGQGKIENIVIGSDTFEVVALIGNSCVCGKIKEKIRDPDLKKVGWTTAFFSTLVQNMRVAKKEPADNEDIERIVRESMTESLDRVGVEPPKLSSDRQPQTARGNPGRPKPPVTIKSWLEVKKEWEAAFACKGIIESNAEMRLELWRAQTDLPKYIVCVQQKREAIRRMWIKMRAFKESKDIRNSVSILLRADPAAGKTHLAKQLASALGFELIAHDISQMVDRDDLTDFFDTIATAQAEQATRDGGVVVFVDEINATLGGSSVYGAFLSPLEAKYYIRRGVKCLLNPCIWLFAGTQKKECDVTGRVSKAEEKLEDFESRLSLIEEIDYQSMLDKCGKELDPRRPNPRDLEHESRLEQVYIGAQAIVQEFSDVQLVQEAILDIFYELPPAKGPLRWIRRLASYLENVQYGRVSLDNCRGPDWQRAIDDTRIRERPLNEGNVRIVQ